jgi:hypothetical protein
MDVEQKFNIFSNGHYNNQSYKVDNKPSVGNIQNKLQITQSINENNTKIVFQPKVQN